MFIFRHQERRPISYFGQKVKKSLFRRNITKKMMFEQSSIQIFTNSSCHPRPYEKSHKWRLGSRVVLELPKFVKMKLDSWKRAWTADWNTASNSQVSWYVSKTKRRRNRIDLSQIKVVHFPKFCKIWIAVKNPANNHFQSQTSEKCLECWSSWFSKQVMRWINPVFTQC